MSLRFNSEEAEADQGELRTTLKITSDLKEEILQIRNDYLKLNSQLMEKTAYYKRTLKLLLEEEEDKTNQIFNEIFGKIENVEKEDYRNIRELFHKAFEKKKRIEKMYDRYQELNRLIALQNYLYSEIISDQKTRLPPAIPMPSQKGILIKHRPVRAKRQSFCLTCPIPSLV